MTKINKALDLNKLFNDQRQGKLLKKHISFPVMVPIKYDGNYTVTEVRDGKTTHWTSGGLSYIHTDNGAECFADAYDGYYLAERIYGLGKLGDRNKCNLRGPKSTQTSTGHTYKVFDYLTLEEYDSGKALAPYRNRHRELCQSGLGRNVAPIQIADNQAELDALLLEAVKEGYEGVMAISPNWKWKHHKTTRKIDFVKYKKRPTVDLRCIGWKEGTGKYEGMIGSLLLKDSKGRQVYVGSGMSDTDRVCSPEHFIGKVIEIEYESIVATYIQATHPPLNEGVLIREEKEID